VKAGYALWPAALLAAGFLVARQPSGDVSMGAFATPLQGRTSNQRHNARLALAALDGVAVGPGEVFSFNERVGTWTRDAGYRKAPVSFNGQLVREWGGGVCQASTTLYNAALLAGMEAVERHPHRHAPSYVPPGRDAAVAFHGIDLKLRNPYGFAVRFAARLEGDRIEVRVLGREKPSTPVEIVTEVRSLDLPRTIVSSASGRSGRVRNEGKPGFDVATFLITGARKRLLSVDSYPPMTRVVERS